MKISFRQPLMMISFWTSILITRKLSLVPDFLAMASKWLQWLVKFWPIWRLKSSRNMTWCHFRFGVFLEILFNKRQIYSSYNIIVLYTNHKHQIHPSIFCLFDYLEISSVQSNSTFRWRDTIGHGIDMYRGRVFLRRLKFDTELKFHRLQTTNRWL